jgi:hypothetical protein
MSDVFDWLKSGSAGHRAKLNGDGSLTISTIASDKLSLEAFKPFARLALQAESEGHIKIEKTHSTRTWYDLIIIYRV